MSELAFNYRGERFAPPSEAAFWRVRRFRAGQRGTLEVVRDDAGLPLIVPIDVTIDAFRAAVHDEAGRYRLDALDASKMALAHVEAAYVSVPVPASHVRAVDDADLELDGEPDVDEAGFHAPVRAARLGRLRNGAQLGAGATVSAPFGTWPALPTPGAMSGVEYLLAEALRGQVQTQVQQMRQLTEVLAVVVNANATGAAQMMAAAAELVRAADGAAMPRREPPPAPPPAPVPPAPPPILYTVPRNAMGPDEDEDEDVEEAGEEEEGADADAEADDFFAKATRLAMSVGQAISPVAEVAKMVAGVGAGGLGAMIGGGLGGGQAGGEAPRNAADADDGGDDASGDEDEPDASFGHLRTSHVLAVSHELGARDGSLFRRMLSAFEPEDRAEIVDRLCAMPIEAATAYAARLVTLARERHDRTQRRSHAPVVIDVGDPIDIGDPELHADGHDEDAAPDEQDADEAPEEHDPDEAPEEREDADHADDGALDAAEPDTDAAAPSAALAPEDAALTRPAGPNAPGPGCAPVAPAVAPSPASLAAPAAPPPVSSAPAVAAAPEAPLPVTAELVARVQQIARHLTLAEVLKAQSLINSTSTVERNAWIRLLMTTPANEAAALIRAELVRRAA